MTSGQSSPDRFPIEKTKLSSPVQQQSFRDEDKFRKLRNVYENQPKTESQSMKEYREKSIDSFSRQLGRHEPPSLAEPSTEIPSHRFPLDSTHVKTSMTYVKSEFPSDDLNLNQSQAVTTTTVTMQENILDFPENQVS